MNNKFTSLKNMSNTAKSFPKKSQQQPKPAQPLMKVVEKPVAEKPTRKSTIKRGLLITAGTVSLLVGIAGIVIPLLPTTPFLLITSWCFVRSSPKLNARLHNNKVLGRYLSNYRDKRGIDPRHRLVALAVLWITLGTSAWFAPHQWYIWLILLTVGVAVSTHLFSLKTVRD